MSGDQNPGDTFASPYERASDTTFQPMRRDGNDLTAREWWKEAVIYQIYPRSFNDTDGDGVGDIPGIVEKVPYLDELGVDLVWLCPVYDSPNADNGYDIRDFQSIMDEFGTMADWDRLLEQLHDRDIRLIMDLVLNHTSNEHEWFQQSRRRKGGYEEYYYWRDGRSPAQAEYDTSEGPDNEVPPNNWESIFGGSAWSYDQSRQQWYLHLFHPNQPDLNWRNPALREDMAEIITWWLEKDIDGFRLDAIDVLSKPDGLPDGNPGADRTGENLYSHGPRLREYLAELHEKTFSNYDVVTVGEMGMTSIEQAGSLLEDDLGLDMIFQFDHLSVDADEGGPWKFEEPDSWKLADLKEIFRQKQQQLDWDALFLGNHDLPRNVSRLADDQQYRRQSATLIGTLLLTLRGTPFIYQGEEIGMTNTDFESLEEIDDPQTLGNIKDRFESGAIDSYDEIRSVVNHRSRDHARTPMQWTDGANAGFTDGEPWLKINENYEAVNVAAALEDEASVWHQYRRLIELRHNSDVLVYGDFNLLWPEHPDLFAYTRELEGERLVVLLNWSAHNTEPDWAAVSDVDPAALDLLVNNYREPAEKTQLRPYEAAVYSETEEEVSLSS